MGAALYSTLVEGESCATIEIKISYFRSARAGELVCETAVLTRGRSVANLESKVFLAGQLVAAANGSYAITNTRT